MKITTGITQVEMPAGTYYVGDPCYNVPDDKWGAWLDLCGDLNAKIIAAEIDGYPVVGVGTSYGDGIYRGSDRFDYPVDAGLIGVVPVEFAAPRYDAGREDLCTKVTFRTPFKISERDGEITIGHIRINTNDEDES